MILQFQTFMLIKSEGPNLWKILYRWTFEEDHVEFSKVVQDKILGTKGEVASLYDVNTGQQVSKFIPTVGNQYSKNKATFSYHDDLILSDGVLFDLNSGKEIHKLDKLNQMQSGVFHPNGLEVNNFCIFILLKWYKWRNYCIIQYQFCLYGFKFFIFFLSIEYQEFI